jgi:hypothetical protein
MRVIIVGAALLALSAEAASAKCNNLPKFVTAGDSEIATTMNVSTGTLCGVTVRPRKGQTLGSPTLSKPPSNGTAIVRGPDRVSYRSDKGYRGADAFSFTVKSTIDGKPAESTVNVAVTVDPSFPRIRRTLGL